MTMEDLVAWYMSQGVDVTIQIRISDQHDPRRSGEDVEVDGCESPEQCITEHGPTPRGTRTRSKQNRKSDGAGHPNDPYTPVTGFGDMHIRDLWRACNNFSHIDPSLREIIRRLIIATYHGNILK